jgi:hypothetical protein
MKNLERLTRQKTTITLPADANGFVGRLCPSAPCRGYFKVKFGTGLKGENPCLCPYCGHKADHGDFTTPDQKKYIESYAMHLISMNRRNCSERIATTSRCPSDSSTAKASRSSGV